MTTVPDPPETPDKHIVDTLIEERAEKLVRSRLWPLYRAILYPLLRYRAAVKMADAIQPLSAQAIFDYISDLLHIDVEAHGVENIPIQDRVLIAVTHPTGISDGVAVFDAIKGHRPDMSFFANRDAVRAAPGVADMIIPVEWVEEKRSPARSRETLASTIEAFRSDKCIVLFPSGRIAAMQDDKTLLEQPWLGSVAIFARKYNCPIVPAHIEARNSWLYYWFWKLNSELRDITLFNELLNKRGQRYKITFGKLIDPTDLKGDANAVASALREHAIGIESGAEWRPLEE
ncbi:MAG: 1-acyl-sn-glycerol-3-phosphate acyltransferase [Pseudomonadota bacterium]